MFATDYPHWDYDDPAAAFKLAMSGQERAMIFQEYAHGASADLMGFRAWRQLVPCLTALDRTFAKRAAEAFCVMLWARRAR